MTATDTSADSESLGALLRRHRLMRGWTQKDLAQYARISARAVQDLERGLSSPRRDTVSRLIMALQVAPDEQARLRAAVRAVRRGARAPRSRRPARHNLPRQLTSFVGREQQVGEAVRLLAGAPLLTLTGAGGAGKTRLALEVAAKVLNAYPGGVWLVELAGLAEPDLVPPNGCRGAGPDRGAWSGS